MSTYRVSGSTSAMVVSWAMAHSGIGRFKVVGVELEKQLGAVQRIPATSEAPEAEPFGDAEGRDVAQRDRHTEPARTLVARPFEQSARRLERVPAAPVLREHLVAD